ncbi:MAG: SDR family NAD(P)-dependent oxidoreductase [Chloroflexi bacterium]|nr:SDR family NAD(P)-dependent oxidoreductase [Chloroflexota bacterium]
MTNDFAGQKVLLTGAASGMGLSTARLLKNLGAELMLWDINGAALEATARELKAQSCVVDVCDKDAVLSAMEQSVAALGGTLNLVIHFPGVMPTGMFDKLALDAHKRTIDINLWGSTVVAYTALPYLKKSKGGLVFLGSVSASYGGPEFALYGATKAAILSLAQALRIELEDDGVYVAVVNPHFVNTPLIDENARQTRFMRAKSLFVEVSTPEHVARTILEGIRKREFMIWPSWRPSLVFHLSRYGHFISHLLMRDTWRGVK